MRASLHLFFLIFLAGCTTVVTQVQLNRELGRPDPARFDRPAAPPACRCAAPA